MNDDDKLLEASARQAIQTANSMSLDRSERDAGDAGVVGHNISDGVMNEGRSYSGMGAAGPGDVQSREMAANRSVVEARRIIEDMGELSMNDLLAPDLASADATTRQNARTQIQADQMYQRMVNTGAQRVVQDSYMNPNEASMLMEQESYTPNQTDDGWGVVKTYAKLKSGKKIPVFMVEDAMTQMNTGKKYRISSVAEKVANVLNVTQNMDDPRINMINTAYDQHVQLMRSLNEARRSKNSQKVSIIETKLSEINTRLGLA
jgi:hypothetical protein